MSFKLKHMIFGKIAIILCLCLVLNNTIVIKSYAEESIATQNPLFIPISTLVATVAVGSGIIARNSSEAIEAGNQLVNSVVNNIKNTEIARKNADSNYVSPYKVINGQGQPEEPNENNKNGKWVGLAGGTIASGEIWANKEMVSDIMRGVYDVKGYQEYTSNIGIVNYSDFIGQASASNIALQLANISNSAVTQFDAFLHYSSFWDSYNITPDDCFFSVNVRVTDILSANPKYPYLYVRVYQKNDNISKLSITGNPFEYNTLSNSYGSLSYYFGSSNSQFCNFINNDNVTVNTRMFPVTIRARSAESSAVIGIGNSSNVSNYAVVGDYSTYSNYAYSGYRWTVQSPFQFTNNVYNVEQTFDVNFPDWLQDSINLLNQNINAVRLGIQSLNEPWNNTQTEVQTGTTPVSIIYQYINNYENPENIPEEEEEPDNPVVVPPSIEEPQPTNDYLNNFLLPESITTKFPFCIPFDIARALRLFSVSQREAPKWECDLNYGSSTYHVVIDLAIFNDVASFIRPLEFIVFLVGLALGTRSLIRG